MASQVRYEPGGRNAIVVCKCSVCLDESPDGCQIERWKRDQHEQTARTARKPVKKVLRPPGRSASSMPVRAVAPAGPSRLPTPLAAPEAHSQAADSAEDVDMNDQPGDVPFEEPMEIDHDTGVQMAADEPQAHAQPDLTFGMYEGDPSDDENDDGRGSADGHAADLRSSSEEAAPADEPPVPAATATLSTSFVSNGLREAMIRDGKNMVFIVSAADTLDDSSPDSAHEHWFVRLVLVVVAFLNLRWHLPHRACAVLLFVLRIIFVCTGLISADDPMPITLKTAYKRLNVQDCFHTIIRCSQCGALFPPDTTPATHQDCPACDDPLWRGSSVPASHDDSDSDDVGAAFQRSGRAAREARTPKQVAPCRLLSDMLEELFRTHPELLEQVQAWMDQQRTDGVLNGMQDGTIWKTMRAHDGTPFFDISNKGEIRLGVTIALDWFKVTTSAFAPSHSSGVFSFSIQNLPEHLRFDPRYLLVSAMTPGPKEPDADQLQHFSAFIVDDLIELYEKGINVKKPDSEETICVRVALVGIVCDHPALCKVAGFGDHGTAAAPCTKCTVSKEDLYDEEVLSGESPHERRTCKDHRAFAEAYRDAASASERADILKANGVRWAEFTRLPYFDPVRMSVIDPMHNVLLGIVKNQWYTCWIRLKALRADTPKTKRELGVLHDFLGELEVPSWAGRMPHDVGIPAGGSLGADEYRSLITIICPMILPFIWNEWRPADDDERDEDVKKARIHKAETHLTLLLACAIKVLFGFSLTENKIRRGEDLLLEYLVTFKALYPDHMKTNHHYSTHLPDQLRDYGPVPGFWAFTVERLNKIMKGLETNHWTGGRLETTMMRYKERDNQVVNLARQLQQSSHEPSVTIAQRLLAEDKVVVREVDEFMVSADDADDRMSSRSLLPGRRCDKKRLDDPRALRILDLLYNSPHKRVYRLSERNRPRSAPLLTDQVHLLSHIVLDGRRIVPVDRSLTQLPCSNALVKVLVNGHARFGEVRSLFQHNQAGIRDSGDMIFAEMSWMVPAGNMPFDENPWKDFPELEVDLWKYQEYRHPDAPDALPAVVQAAQFICQVARGVCRTTKPPLWITCALEKHAILMGFTSQSSSLYDPREL